MSIKKIVIFEDSEVIAKAYVESAREQQVSYRIYRSPYLNDLKMQELAGFNPDLFVIDLLLGDSKLDGYRLIRSLQGNSILRGVPIVVVSQFINSSPFGQQEAKNLLSIGVTAALSKIPNIPSISTLLSYCRKESAE